VTLRRTLLTSHLIIGAILAPVLVVLGITGAILAVQPELEDASNALLTHIEPGTAPLPFEELTAKLQSRYPGAALGSVRFPERPDRALLVGLHRPDSADANVIVNPYTGVVLGLGDEIWALRPVHDLHTRLLLNGVGRELTGWTAVGLIFLSLSGMILWWPGKILTIVRTGSGRRVLFHLHSALAAYSWIALMCFGVSAMVLHWQDTALTLANRVTGAAPAADGFGLSVTSCAKDSAAGFDALLAAATADQPGAGVTWIEAGEPGTDPVRVVLRHAGDRTPAGRTLVFLDPCTAKVLASVSTQTAPLAYRAVRQWNRELHTGDLFGWPTRILAFLFALTLPVVAVSGPLLWWSRRKTG
jgi:uncharacterized iron-regulated membrane protein